MKPGKLASVLPITSRTNEKRQGLTFYRNFVQMASDLRRAQLCTLKNQLTFHFKTTFFFVYIYKEKEPEGKGFRI